MVKRDGTLMLVITNKCNLRCTYCYEDHSGKEPMSLQIAQENINKVLNDDEKYNSINISLFGGEPFLYYERVKEICEWTWSIKWKVPYVFNFTTNGTVISEDAKEWLKRNNKRIFITLSADGTKKTQDINRSNSFDLIDYDFFLNNWNKPQVKMTISRESLANLASDVVFFHDKGFEFADCNLAMGIDWSNKKYIQILKEQLNLLIDYYRINKNISPAQIVYVEVGSCENERVMHKWCGVGRELMTIDVDGRKYPCNLITPMSFSEEELEILLKKDFTNIRDIVDEDCFKECYLYPICPTCYGTDYKVTQSFKMKDKTICELMKIRAYYSAMLKAERILDMQIEECSIEEKGKIYKTIQAIKKISEKYSASI